MPGLFYPRVSFHPHRVRPADKTYRPDIDGLRAIAVLAVLVHHVFPSLLPAGFIGGDILIVLSGYLIAKIIVGEKQRGTFSFGAFYVRRFRRVFPALGVVLAGTLALGAALLTPTEIESLGRHIVAAGLFSSNFLLWHDAGGSSSTSRSIVVAPPKNRRPFFAFDDSSLVTERSPSCRKPGGAASPKTAH